MKRKSIALLMLVSELVSLPVLAGSRTPTGVSFRKHLIDPDLPAISAVAVDVDGDGRLDVVAGGGPTGARSKWSNLLYWYHAPNWEKHPVDTLEPEAIILHLQPVDFTRPASARAAGPSPAEFVVAARGRIRWYRYDRPAERWTGTILVEDVAYAHGIAAGDIDHDGYDDLLVPYQPTAARGEPPRRGVLWAQNPGRAGTWTSPWAKHPLAATFAIDGWLHYVALADLNEDGRLDALLGSQGKTGWFGVWLQPAEPAGVWPARVLKGPIVGGTHLEAADLNGDGKADLVGAEGHGRGLWWFRAPDYTPIRIDETLTNAHCLALGDFNGDGTRDLVSCGYAARKVAVFLNDGTGGFEKRTIDDSQCAYDARAVDLNGDGRLDVLLSGQNSGNLVWYENRAPD